MALDDQMAAVCEGDIGLMGLKREHRDDANGEHDTYGKTSKKQKHDEVEYGRLCFLEKKEKLKKKRRRELEILRQNFGSYGQMPSVSAFAPPLLQGQNADSQATTLAAEGVTRGPDALDALRSTFASSSDGRQHVDQQPLAQMPSTSNPQPTSIGTMFLTPAKLELERLEEMNANLIGSLGVSEQRSDRTPHPAGQAAVIGHREDQCPGPPFYCLWPHASVNEELARDAGVGQQILLPHRRMPADVAAPPQRQMRVAVKENPKETYRQRRQDLDAELKNIERQAKKLALMKEELILKKKLLLLEQEEDFESRRGGKGAAGLGE